jgi:hypothetical protein
LPTGVDATLSCKSAHEGTVVAIALLDMDIDIDMDVVARIFAETKGATRVAFA